jgi:hypothetical protein
LKTVLNRGNGTRFPVLAGKAQAVSLPSALSIAALDVPKRNEQV